MRFKVYCLTSFPFFSVALPGIPGSDASLLDHSVLLYGSNMSNSNAHNHFPLPNLLLGGASGRLKGNRHLKYPDHTPMTNLLLTALDKAGMNIETLGDSTGRMIEV